MMYGFLTLSDDTELTHSELREKDGQTYVKVYVERPVETGFQSGWCTLPGYQWEDVHGFTPEDIAQFTRLIASKADLIFVNAKEISFSPKEHET